jgi:hypothetical protein
LTLGRDAKGTIELATKGCSTGASADECFAHEGNRAQPVEPDE